MSGSDQKIMDWTPQKGESNLWFSRFILYRDKGPERALLSTYRTHMGHQGKYPDVDCAPGAWGRAYKKWQWASRAAMWDAEQLRMRDARNLQRQIDLEELSYKVAVMGIERCEKMLTWPLATQRVEGVDDAGQPTVTVVEATGWSQGTVANLMRASTAVAREACGVGLVRHDGAQVGTDDDSDEYLTLDDIKFLTEFVEPSESPETS